MKGEKRPIFARVMNEYVMEQFFETRVEWHGFLTHYVHGNIQYIKKQPHLLQSLNFIQ